MTGSESKKSATYASKVSENMIIISLFIVVLVAIVFIGWKRENGVHKWQGTQPPQASIILSAPELNLLTNGFDNR